MKKKLPVTSNDSLQLRLVTDSEGTLSDEVQVDLAEERNNIEKLAEAEEFWAGRNLAGRNSTRWAA
jgi:hypothetical protein